MSDQRYFTLICVALPPIFAFFVFLCVRLLRFIMLVNNVLAFFLPIPFEIKYFSRKLAHWGKEVETAGSTAAEAAVPSAVTRRSTKVLLVEVNGADDATRGLNRRPEKWGWQSSQIRCSETRGAQGQLRSLFFLCVMSLVNRHSLPRCSQSLLLCFPHTSSFSFSPHSDSPRGVHGPTRTDLLAGCPLEFFFCCLAS